ncbi:MAG: GAF domain-containing protein, partial [Actinomycetota bacterium]|nr:GAF domain-containing protein [Actinomycetota bacterium]
MSEQSTAGYEQALRYAEELRELYREARAQADTLAAANRDLERRESELEALHAIDQSILGVVPFETTLGIAEAAIRRLSGADRVGVMVVDTSLGVIRAPAGPEGGHEEELPSSGVVADAISVGERRWGVPATDATSWERIAAADGLGWCMATPLREAGGVVGVAAIAWRDGHAVGEAQMDSIERIAAQLAVALRAGKLDADKTRRAAELEAVLDVSHAVAGSLELKHVLAAAVDRSLALTGLQMGIVSLVDDRSDELVAMATRGLVPPVSDLVARVPVSSPLGRLMVGTPA